MKPDLDSAEGRRAYRRELRRIAVAWRAFGFALLLAGTAGMVVFGRGPQSLLDSAEGVASLGLAALGWIALIVVIAKRTRYHKARMAEPAGSG